jgi:hypothetical protein
VPPTANPYERLQFVRTKFYAAITAAGPGKPVDVPPNRVAAFLTGTPASPYEIAAAEALMARWAGIPARVGYGYYDDTKSPKNGVYEIRSTDGAMWIEAYFAGYGWLPIVGKPPRAQSSLSATTKKQQFVPPSGEVAAQLYIPIREQGLQLLYTIVRYWLVRAGAVVAGAVLLWLLLPGLLKSVRRVVRRRWAERLGFRSRMLVAYAELRDRAIDFNIGHPTDTPLEFLDVLEPDDDHTQLAWAVTRAAWGDLQRDLQREDVETAEALAKSLLRRLNAGQPLLMRAVAFSSRVSLREPWTNDIPNPYWNVRLAPAVRRVARASLRAVDPRRLGRLRRLAPSFARPHVLLLALALLSSGCVQRIDATTTAGAAPLPSVPPHVGSFEFEPDPSGQKAFARYRAVALVSDLALYAVRDRGTAVGTLQTATFKPGLRALNSEVRQGVLETIGGNPTVIKVAGERFYTVTINDIKLLVWFTPDGARYQLLAATRELPDPEALLSQLIAAQRGTTVNRADLERRLPPGDVRRGTP